MLDPTVVAQSSAPQPDPPGGAVAPAVEIQARIVNGILVIVVVTVVGLLYAYKPGDAAMFGAFTTLVGTALSAYFGISATREVSRNATDSANARTADTRQQLAHLQANHTALASKVTSARTLLAQPQMADDQGTMAQVRSILAT
jgi:uncharacterized protein YlxW (UPF0749 family)